MKIIKQNWEFEHIFLQGDDMLRFLEKCGRTCYKSEDKITPESAKIFLKKIIDSEHHSVIEHFNISVRIITDRGVTHELVRHRIAAHSQESTRYCRYNKEKFGNELTVILPVWFYDYYTLGYPHKHPESNIEKGYLEWYTACKNSEKSYFGLLNLGQSSQQARSVLSNSLKTEIITTMNLRSWRNFFQQRCSIKAHPQMRDLALSMLIEFKKRFPIIFDDIMEE